MNSVQNKDDLRTPTSFDGEFVSTFLSRRSEFLPQIDAAIGQSVQKHCRNTPQRLRDAIEYSWLAPGKRLRPLLALLAAETVGGDPMVAMPAAVAVEAVHCYSLIHDDLPAMDDDDLRRGRPTCHMQFDEATAILAGDALQPLAFACLADGLADPIVVKNAVQLLSEAAGPNCLVGGQMEDIMAEREKTGDADRLKKIHAGKTGAMIRVSTQLGAICSKADSRQMQAITNFGNAVGLAFQIVDDLLDVESSSESMGKRTGKDAMLGKLTYPGIFGIEESRRKAKALIGEAIEALSIFSSSKAGLIGLAHYVCQRSN